MRRFFVIFLILLFPLNVLALSASVSSLQTGVTKHVASAAADGMAADAGELDLPVAGDLDSDEPPPGMDFHDSVSGEGQVQPAVRPDGSVSSHVSSRRGLAPFPPIKPPPVR